MDNMEDKVMSVHNNRMVKVGQPDKSPIFWCNHCSLKLTTPTIARQHLIGHSHRVKLELKSLLKSNIIDKGLIDYSSSKATKRGASAVFNDECNPKMVKTDAKARSICNRNQYSDEQHMINKYCSICKVLLNSETQVLQHYNGSKHKFNAGVSPELHKNAGSIKTYENKTNSSQLIKSNLNNPISSGQLNYPNRYLSILLDGNKSMDLGSTKGNSLTSSKNVDSPQRFRLRGILKKSKPLTKDTVHGAPLESFFRPVSDGHPVIINPNRRGDNIDQSFSVMRSIRNKAQYLRSFSVTSSVKSPTEDLSRTFPMVKFNNYSKPDSLVSNNILKECSPYYIPTYVYPIQNLSSQQHLNRDISHSYHQNTIRHHYASYPKD